MADQCKMSEHIVTVAKDYSLLFEGKVNWTQRKDMIRIWSGVAKQVAKLEDENERLQECVLEAYRIHNEAHLQADHYAYDLMRTVMRPLEGEVGCYPLIENALLEGDEE